ncbi:MAG TPA: hypothetical protein VKA49_12465 [Flavitalea sp.]|nr:hypothetical protein [Flavitalea sp.]
MKEHFPLQYTLASGTEVTVDKKNAETYEFILKAHERAAENFIYVNDGRPKAEWDEALDFEQLEALRTFWLKYEGVV